MADPSGHDVRETGEDEPEVQSIRDSERLTVSLDEMPRRSEDR
ncbi:hypothetical protein [Streptosporangium sp. NPDC000396]